MLLTEILRNVSVKYTELQVFHLGFHFLLYFFLLFMSLLFLLLLLLLLSLLLLSLLILLLLLLSFLLHQFICYHQFVLAFLVLSSYVTKYKNNLVTYIRHIETVIEPCNIIETLILLSLCRETLKRKQW